MIRSSTGFPESPNNFRPDRFLTGLILNLGKGNRGHIRAGNLILTQNFDPPRSDFDDQSTIWTNPCLLAAGYVNRIATSAVNRERVPFFGSQQVPDPINHKLSLIPKPTGYKAGAQNLPLARTPGNNLPGIPVGRVQGGGWNLGTGRNGAKIKEDLGRFVAPEGLQDSTLG